MKYEFICYSCNPNSLVSENAISFGQAILKHEKKFKHDTLPSEQSPKGKIIKRGSFKV